LTRDPISHTRFGAVRKDAPEETNMSLINRLRALVTDDSGQDMLEYALLTALIALAAVVAVRAAGVEVNSIFGEIQQELAQ
jgi:Flp pilus assembly pilin Flp